ncbi:hypothetical protein TUBRATIS_10120 [Tubulinosema ratisbonensis]|uniref:Uncharacterized protein n=1 Tax=Tubulinosema ratisbonensis TaxID=291195 RepID=A0A437AMT8_9MICR|nr:hypothetical protein TUBRATIS_10120 [Tubulinosema ratisbonensis]
MIQDFLQKIFSPKKAPESNKDSKKMKVEQKIEQKEEKIKEELPSEQTESQKEDNTTEEKKVIREVYICNDKSKNSYDNSFNITSEEEKEFVLSINELKNEVESDLCNEKLEEIKQFIKNELHEIKEIINQKNQEEKEIINKKFEDAMELLMRISNRLTDLENKQKEKSSLRAVRIKKATNKKKEDCKTEEKDKLNTETNQSENMACHFHKENVILNENIEECQTEINLTENKQNEILINKEFTKEKNEIEEAKNLILAAIKNSTEKSKDTFLGRK